MTGKDSYYEGLREVWWEYLAAESARAKLAMKSLWLQDLLTEEDLLPSTKIALQDRYQSALTNLESKYKEEVPERQRSYAQELADGEESEAVLWCRLALGDRLPIGAKVRHIESDLNLGTGEIVGHHTMKPTQHCTKLRE